MAKEDLVRPLSDVALLRFHVVSLVRARRLAGADLADAVLEVTSLGHPSKDSLLRVSTRSVYRWVAAYEAGGPVALEDAPRVRKAASRVLSEKLLDFVCAEHERDREASIPELLRRAMEKHVIASLPDRTTVYRALGRLGVPTGRTKKERGRDMRRFAYAHRMEMVLADGKHFRAGVERLRRVALFFLDDATRYGLDVVVGPSESSDLFLRGFHRVLVAFGRMGVLYLDHGSGFIADAVAEVCRRLHIALVHGESRYPEGHGKVERFNQTAQNAVLRSLAGRVDVDPACEALELRLGHWLVHVYNHQPHESLVRP
jgi:transposase InsO family protein